MITVRHAVHVLTNEERENYLRERIPHNTLRLFNAWHREWKARLNSVLKVHEDLMEKFDLNESLKIFLLFEVM